MTAITLCVVGGKSGLPKLGPERIVSKKLDAPYRSGKSKAWIKVRNPDVPAAARAIDGIF